MGGKHDFSKKLHNWSTMLESSGSVRGAGGLEDKYCMMYMYISSHRTMENSVSLFCPAQKVLCKCQLEEEVGVATRTTCRADREIKLPIV